MIKWKRPDEYKKLCVAWNNECIENKDETSMKKNKSFPQTINELVQKMNEYNSKHIKNINE